MGSRIIIIKCCDFKDSRINPSLYRKIFVDQNKSSAILKSVCTQICNDNNLQNMQIKMIKNANAKNVIGLLNARGMFKV
jgi:hypothetical protein